MSNYCVDCGKEIGSQSKRCRSCALKNNWKHPTEKMLETSRKNGRKNMKIFSNSELLEMWQRFENGAFIKDIGKIFGCSYSVIRHFLIKIFGEEKYLKIAKKHFQETTKLMQKKNAKNHNYISKPEKKFYALLISQNPHLTIKRQYYLKGLNHAYDLAIPELNLLIEVDGGHSKNKEMNAERIKRDAEVDKFAKDNGWKVIRINDKILKKLGIIK